MGPPEVEAQHLGTIRGEGGGRRDAVRLQRGEGRRKQAGRGGSKGVSECVCVCVCALGGREA